jgi:VIT1/CCC1 family predicted Fe2+/Mn2+ transporter
VELRDARHRTGLWVASRHPAGILYGAIITGAVISATAGHETSARRIVATTLFVLGVYWLADVYVRAFAHQFREGRDTLTHRLAAASRHESGVLLGGVPALGTFTIATALGMSSSTAADLALWLTVVVLGALAYLAARYAGAPIREALAEAALAGMLGILMIVSKALLH